MTERLSDEQVDVLEIWSATPSPSPVEQWRERVHCALIELQERRAQDARLAADAEESPDYANIRAEDWGLDWLDIIRDLVERRGWYQSDVDTHMGLIRDGYRAGHQRGFSRGAARSPAVVEAARGVEAYFTSRGDYAEVLAPLTAALDGVKTDG